MQIRTQPSPASINIDPSFKDSFWYWHGQSGRRYIHSVYPAQYCPMLPGAVYLSVRRIDDDRFVPLAVEVGGVIDELVGAYCAADGADEVHVHLLAEDNREALSVMQDLKAGLFPRATGQTCEQLSVISDLQFSLFDQTCDSVAAAA